MRRLLILTFRPTQTQGKPHQAHATYQCWSWRKASTHSASAPLFLERSAVWAPVVRSGSVWSGPACGGFVIGGCLSQWRLSGTWTGEMLIGADAEVLAASTAMLDFLYCLKPTPFAGAPLWWCLVSFRYCFVVSLPFGALRGGFVCGSVPLCWHRC